MEYRFDFDDQLPDLPIAFDFEEVAELFERKVFNSSQESMGTLNVKKLQDVKYKPSQRCVTTYELEGPIVLQKGQSVFWILLPKE